MIKHILKKIRLLSNARKEPYLLFQKVLGFYPDKIEYYQLAVRHGSVSITTEEGRVLSNERLEFLGDAVLNSVVTDILYRRYENQREGFLTNTRSKLVKRDSLNQLALEIGLDKLILMTKHANANTNKNIYGNALEALMGAIYLDHGYKRCKTFVEKRLIQTFNNLDAIAEQEVNYKSKLIEWCQKHKLDYVFILVEETILEANRHHFVTRLVIEGKTICEASGSSKKESQQNVCKIADDIIKKDKKLYQTLRMPAEEPEKDDESLDDKIS